MSLPAFFHGNNFGLKTHLFNTYDWSYKAYLGPGKFALFTSVFMVQFAIAQQDPTTYSDQNKLIKAPQAVTRLGTDLFGDRVNLYTGSLEFIQTDVSLPGNSPLPVAVGRHLRVGEDPLDQTLFGRWDIEIPHLHGIFSLQRGWSVASGTTNRCSQFGPPPNAASPTASWSGTEYWHGSFLYVPGIGDQEMLQRSSTNTKAPTGRTATSYPVVTRNNWAIGCLPNMAIGNGGSGEGFIAVSPDGTEYRFDWMVSRTLPPLQKSTPFPELNSTPSGPSTSTDTQSTTGMVNSGSSIGGSGGVTPAVSSSPQLNRVEIWILPTLVTDRFGNTVTYTYDTTNKWQLKKIVDNDSSGSPRTITLTYQTPGSTTSNLVASVSDGTRTWRYAYDNYGQLQTVTLPDNSAWKLGGISSLLFGIQYLADGTCEAPGYLSTDQITGSMTHPSGAIGGFTLTGTRHGRSGVEYQCTRDITTNSEHATYPKNFDTYALTNKTLQGPGLSPLTWTTQYPAEESSWGPCNGCIATKAVSVTVPDGSITRHTFGTLFRETEGQLLGTETISASGETLRSTTIRYREVLQPLGTSQQRRGDGIMSARVMEVDKRETLQQGTTFTWEATQFDGFAHPTQIGRYSSLGFRRNETTAYDDNFTKWVLGQIKTVTDTDSAKIIVQNDYSQTDSSNTPITALLNVKKFGKLQQSLTYFPDGNINTVKDEKNPATTYSSYKRGIAQRIDYPDGSYESVVVNGLGKITSMTNEAGATHTFTYDAMGRITTIKYPSADTVAWNQTTISFAPVASAEYGLDAGHWKQTITTGTATEVSYLDAFWRPVYLERYDSADKTNTSRVVKHQYDFDGRTTFDSYPQRNYQSTTLGVSNEYDALGRLTKSSIDSDIGPLYEYVNYSSGFQKSHTNAKNNTTTYSYQAFDQPVENAIVSVTMPENVYVTINRDTFGKTKTITRSGAGLSQTRSYVYDSNERLCKTIEPETGATVQSYDLANNVSWRASGLTLTSPASCDTASVVAAKKASFTYDTRNRLNDTTFGDTSAAIKRTYTADGLPDTISSNGTLWTYTYNKRRLLEGETLDYGGSTYKIARSYDANGSLSQLRYPVDNLTLTYNPNALGEPRQIGSYATAITFYPNGALASFTYGNGIKHTVQQNIRGLPSRSTDGAVLDEIYAYDKNNNVESIYDVVAPATATRAMTYDTLDRLKSVSAPNLWGTATYDYDALDNLVSTAITSGQNARNTVHNIDYTTNRLASITNGPANFNFAYGYDAQGNITSRGGQTYQFDIANRMKAAPGRATYVYDGLGRRVSVVGTDGVNRVQVYSQAGQLLYVTAGASATKYIYLHNHQIAEVK